MKIVAVRNIERVGSQLIARFSKLSIAAGNLELGLYGTRSQLESERLIYLH